MTPSGAVAGGFGTFLPYLILMIVFAGATFLPMVLMQMGQKDNPQRNQTMIMAGVMSLFMLWISWSSPLAFFCSGAFPPLLVCASSRSPCAS